MTLSYGVFYTLIIFCSIGLVVLIIYLLNKYVKNVSDQVASVVGSLIVALGIGCFFFLKTLKTPVIEVRGFDSEEYAHVFGSSFTASDEQEVKLDDDVDGAIVVNISDQTMFVEHIEYSIAGMVDLDAEDAVEEVPAHSFTVLDREPDFYPWDGAPAEIRVSGNRLYARMIWLHY